LPAGCLRGGNQGETRLILIVALYGCRRILRAAGLQTCVTPLSEQGSASLKSLALADALIILETNQTSIHKGDIVDVVPLWRGF